jgi:hypothetical protein
MWNHRIWLMLLVCAPLILAGFGCSEDTDDDDAAGDDDDATSGDDDDATSGDDDDQTDDDDDSGAEYWFGGGCYDITDAPVDDSCFSDAVDVPTLMLAAINAVRSAAGEPDLTNPIDVSARVEEGLERVLVESLPPFPVERISVEDYEAETFHLELPNPLDYQMDPQGNVTGYGTFTLDCSANGDVVTCVAEDVQFNLTAVILSLVSGYAVTTQPEWDCWMSIDVDATLDYTSGPQTLQWDLSYALAVEQQSCNDLIELFFDDASTPCGMETAMTLDRVGDLNESGQCD